jgi:hydroxylamine dehydrogenase
MWEHDLIKLYKGLFHVNPGGFTYTEGWSELMKDYTQIMNENTVLREKQGNRPSKSGKQTEETSSSNYVLAIVLVLLGIGIFWFRKR